MTSLVTFITIIHLLAAIGMIALVLIQDTKSGGALGIGGAANANSILGATGAQTLAAKLTVIIAIIFAFTSLGLAYFASRHSKSIIDEGTLTPPAATGSSTPTTDTSNPAPSDNTPLENKANVEKKDNK